MVRFLLIRIHPINVNISITLMFNVHQVCWYKVLLRPLCPLPMQDNVSHYLVTTWTLLRHYYYL